MQIDPDTMILSVAEEEHVELQEVTRRVFNTRNHAPGSESNLLYVAVKVLRIFVQLPEVMHRKLTPWPDFYHVKEVETKILWVRLFRLHYLHAGSPFDLLALLDGILQVPPRVIRIISTHANSLSACEMLLPVLRQEVIFNIDKGAVFIHPANCLKAGAAVAHKLSSNGTSKRLQALNGLRESIECV